MNEQQENIAAALQSISSAIRDLAEAIREDRDEQSRDSEQPDFAEAERIRDIRSDASIELWNSERTTDRARRIAARKRFDAAHERWKVLQAKELQAIAAANGWTVSKRGFSLDGLKSARRDRGFSMDGTVLDHCEFFLDSEGRPAGIISHTYRPLADCERFAAQHGLKIRQLPYSWYYPGDCTALLLTRRDGVA